MTREKWESMTPEERRKWRERKDRRDFIVYSIIVPIVITAILSPITSKIIVSLFHK